MARGPAPEITPTTTGRIHNMIVERFPYRTIQERMLKEYRKKIPLGTIHNIKKRWDRRGHLYPLPRSGRPRATTLQDEKHIGSLVQRGKVRNAADLKRHYYARLSTSTIRRVFHRLGYQAYRRRKVSFLTTLHRRIRRVWARMLQDWDFWKWRHCFFSDESKYNLLRSDGRDFAWRKKGRAYDPRYTIKTKKFGGGKVIVWGCIMP